MMTTYHSKKHKSVKDMAKILKSKYEIDFYNSCPEALKTQAISRKSHIIDITVDIKELLNDSDKRKYEKINSLLEIFFEALKNPLEE